MANNDTLDLHSLRSEQPQPITTPSSGPEPSAGQPAPTETANHPQAAAAARERIATLHDAHPLAHPDAIPAAPTTSLITDKNRLAASKDLGPSVTRRRLPSAMIPLLTAAGVFALVLLLFKAPIIFSQLSYSLSRPTPAASPIAGTAGSTTVIPAESTITIPKINVHAPVVYIDSVQEADVQRALQDGVVHYGTTAVPGQNGNVAIFGHSSNDWWEPGNYKFVFVLLDKLSPGDQITVDYQSTRYTYEVTGSRIVEPTAVDVLNPTPTPTLTLITCSPPGTSLRRLVVSAKQVSPVPANQGQTATNSQSGSGNQAQLPSSAPNFFTQVGNFFNGIAQGFMSLFGGGAAPKPNSSPAPNDGQIPVIK